MIYHDISWCNAHHSSCLESFFCGVEWGRRDSDSYYPYSLGLRALVMIHTTRDNFLSNIVDNHENCNALWELKYLVKFSARTLNSLMQVLQYNITVYSTLQYSATQNHCNWEPTHKWSLMIFWIGTEIRFQEYLFTDHSLIINCLKTITIVGKLSKALSE